MEAKPLQHPTLEETQSEASTYTTDPEHKSKVARRYEGKAREGRYTTATMPKRVKRVRGKAQRAARRRNRK